LKNQHERVKILHASAIAELAELPGTSAAAHRASISREQPHIPADIELDLPNDRLACDGRGAQGFQGT
jgi:hypothetical protein